MTAPAVQSGTCRWCGAPISRDPRIGVWRIPAVPDPALCLANTFSYCHQPPGPPGPPGRRGGR